MRTKRITRTRLLAPMLAVALAAVTACGSATSGNRVSIVAYSVPKPAYDALTTAFGKTRAGQGVSFRASYGASGDQSRAVRAGQPADYVTFSVEPDMTKLVPKFVDPSWDAGATHGLVSESVVVLVVRKGNPKHIAGWDDLVKPGVKVVTPDPGSSGSAKWNILGAYTHVLDEGGTEAQAQTYLRQFFAHVVAKPESGSKATQTFLNGTGDVLVSYENEAIQARAKGLPLEYVVPKESILIQNPAAVTKRAPKSAKDFLTFVESKQGQTIFASKGYRPVLAGIDPGHVAGANDPAYPFPDVTKLATIQDLGGWTVVNKRYFDPTTGIVTKIEGSSG
jgi:sulfate/thiosulfate transport system substrate-binding protein